MAYTYINHDKLHLPSGEQDFAATAHWAILEYVRNIWCWCDMSPSNPRWFARFIPQVICAVRISQNYHGVLGWFSIGTHGYLKAEVRVLGILGGCITAALWVTIEKSLQHLATFHNSWSSKSRHRGVSWVMGLPLYRWMVFISWTIPIYNGW